MGIRDSFVARFGEGDAVIIEEAATRHLAEGPSSVHANDRWGSDSFRYLWIVAIGRECPGKYIPKHGLSHSQAEYRDWSTQEAHIEQHDGDWPDYIALLAGGYRGWYDPADGELNSGGLFRGEMLLAEMQGMFSEAMNLFNSDPEGPSS